MKHNGFKQAKERSRRYTAQTITDVDYADDITLLVNTPNQAETPLQRLERAAACIGLPVNTCDISTLNSSSPKLVDKFTYLESSISSTETDIDTRLAKA